MDTRAEHEQLQDKVNTVVDESLESTRRMRQLCEDSKEAGIRTLVALDEQGEQLDRIEEDLDKINADMRHAEKALTGMEKCCGLFRCSCVRHGEFKDENRDAWKGDDNKGTIIGGQPIRTVDDRNGVAMVQGGYIARITKDAREDEMEENMQEVANMIGNLRNMAIDMGQEIGQQNQQLGRITQKADSNKTRIETANERTQKLLGNR